MKNELIHETSPYLLQHAGNPVHWQAWNPETLELARTLNKPLLISIGYAACHWCHVMERECFENQEVADLMNHYFINIKIDREERPDLDMVYMQALQIMTGSGGWPLNIVALPDGQPFWGATYMHADTWSQALKQLGTLYRENPERIRQYAAQLSEGIRMISLYQAPEDPKEQNALDPVKAVQHWSQYFDTIWGGRKGAPKFMMPVNLEFLLHYGWQMKDPQVSEYVRTTLNRMAMGGLYDPVGGGFARYSTDERWHIPHFEKMLYDNAQLISLYSMAYRLWKDEYFLEVAFQTLEFTRKELRGNSPLFFSSLDADSPNQGDALKEGAFYTWTKGELSDILGENFEVFAEVFHIDQSGYWEEDQYVLFRTQALEEIARQRNISLSSLKNLLNHCLELLNTKRAERVRPRLDDKCLTSWNALMLKACCELFKASGNTELRKEAEKLASNLCALQLQENGNLWHTYKNGQSRIEGFLEDYALLISGLLSLYEITGSANWLQEAKNLTLYTLDHFSDDLSPLFYFSKREASVPVSRQLEKSDNVIPASNSVMAHNLFLLGQLLSVSAYSDRAREMLNVMTEDSAQYPYSHANWLRLRLLLQHPFYEVAISGDQAGELSAPFFSDYRPDCLVCFSTTPSDLPLLKDRFPKEDTLIYVCRDSQCELPVNTYEQALTILGQ